MYHRTLALHSLISGIFVLLLGTGAAFAHSFNLLVVVPEAGPVAEDMRRAVLLAAEERDGHPDNHSDGHLGGLDLYLTLSSELSEPHAWDEAQPDIVLDVLLFPLAHYEHDEPQWVALYGHHLDRLDRAPILAEAAEPAITPFATRFKAATGREPGPEAEAAYLGARLVDLIVRPLDDASDPKALSRELDALD